jgi:glycosyltransferase involved in cell wall biosynthesis
MNKFLVCAIYNHPEAYPPTLNAIAALSKIYDKVCLIYRPNLRDEWKFPENVILIKNGKVISAGDQAKLGFIKKALIFFSFGVIFFRTCVKYKPKTILVYDAISLLCYHHFRKILHFKHLIWYHNHDVAEPNTIRKYSVGWWALKSERITFKYLSIFSLPSTEREKYFDLDLFKGKYFYLPNFPSLAFYSQFPKSKRPVGEVKLIYQGSVSPDHGLEEIMAHIQASAENMRLILIGHVEAPYKDFLIHLSDDLNIEKKLEILKPVNYQKLPPITASGHIGLAINKPTSIIYSTGGTASNKIYEYAASGLPILYFDSAHYKKYLENFHWAVSTDLSRGNLRDQIQYICSNYEELSAAAIRDFNTNLNFEKIFEPLGSFLRENS